MKPRAGLKKKNKTKDRQTFSYINQEKKTEIKSEMNEDMLQLISQKYKG